MTKTESPGEAFPIDELLAFRDGADRHGRAPDLVDIRALINKVAAPYLARIAGLEERLADLTAPPTADGKTPGQVDYEAYSAARLGLDDRGSRWEHLDERTKQWNEAGAEAVLRAFGGRPGQTTQTNAVDALRRVMARFVEESRGVSPAEVVRLHRVVDAEIAKFKDLEPTPIADLSKARARITELETALRKLVEPYDSGSLPRSLTIREARETLDKKL